MKSLQNTTFLTAALICFSCASASAASVPRPSAYDSRMQQVDYSASNTTVVNARLGFLTTVVFDIDESIVKAKSGFDSGWDISTEGNKVYISPRPAAQEQEIINDDGSKEKINKLFEPTAAEWHTNLFITSTKRDYSAELNLIEADNKKALPAFVINYKYPDEKREKDSKEEQERIKTFQAAQENKVIAQKLENGQAPRNWDYYMRPGKDSQNITPDFAYDDGVMTYIGFSPYKIFPSVTKYLNGKEQTPAFSVQQKGNYKIMVVHSLDQNLILRHGVQVIGVVNQSFGKVVTPYKNTSSTQVERVEVKNDK